MPASKQQPGKVGDWAIDPGRVDLIDLKFDRLDKGQPLTQASDDPVEVDFDLQVARLGEDDLAVALRVNVAAAGTISISVMAGTLLKVEHPDVSAEEVDQEMAKIAAQVGPVIVYPYIRELVADLTRRSGLGTLTLPIYQVGTMFEVSPDEVKLRKSAKRSTKRTAATAPKKAKRKQ